MLHEMMHDIDAVIFDMDGSLVDSMWMWRAIDIEYLGRYGIALPEDLQTKIEGQEEIMEEWNRMAWDKYMYEVPLKKGIPEFLAGCRDSGIKLGIATSNSRVLVENVAGVHNLRDYFSCIMTGTDVERGKPSPDIYLTVAEGLGVSPERCLVFEDITAGILAGKNAGMRVCAVEDDYSAQFRELKKELADYYIEDYTGLFV